MIVYISVLGLISMLLSLSFHFLQFFYFFFILWCIGAYAGEFKVIAGLVGGPGVWAARTPENFENLEIFLKEIALFWPLFQRNFKNPALKFLALGEKHNWLGNFWKIFENSWW